MFFEAPNVLTAEELRRVADIAETALFADGRLSNPHTKVKNNLQIDQRDPGRTEAANLMANALMRHQGIRDFAFPRIMAPPMLSKYGPGMAYGLHTDAAFLPVGPRPLRSDVSCTLFISPPENYEGGELSIQLGARALRFKGPAGSAIAYPSTTLHEVTPVTAGERVVGLTFIESAIPDPAHRDLLYTLNEVAALEGLGMAWENRTRLQYVCNNLHRIWGEKE